MTTEASSHHELAHELATSPRYTAAEVAHFVGVAPRTMKAWLGTGALRDHRVSFERMIDVLQREDQLTGDVERCDGRAVRWFPRGREQHIALDPRISAGLPIVARRGIGTRFIAERYCAGWDPEEIADDYILTMDELRAALAFEGIEPSQQ